MWKLMRNFQEVTLKLKKFRQGANLRDKFVSNQTLQFMSLQDVKQVLFDTNLNFDSQMSNDVLAFINSHGIQIDSMNIHLKSIACAAILSELKRVPTINGQGYTKYGITIETIMSHLNGYSKQEFLQILSSTASKDQNINNKLSPKIKNVSLCYRLFKKYRKSFQELWVFTGIGTLVMNDMLSIFWVVYVLAKNKSDQIYSDIQQQIKLIVILIKSIFQYWIAQVEESYFNKVIEDNFSYQTMTKITQQIFLLRHVEYLNLIQTIYSLRYENKQIDLKRFSKNAIQIARYLDDITNYFYREKEFFQIENYTDQISFLELKKVLAPKPLQKTSDQNIEPIQKSLSFKKQATIDTQEQESKKQNINELNIDSESRQQQKRNLQYMIVQNLAAMTPLRQKRDISGATPCSNRLENLEWVRNCLDYMNRQEESQLFRKIFSLTQKQSSADYERKTKARLLQMIQEFTPKCIKKQKRIQEIFSFFKFFIFQIFKTHKECDNAQMFKDVKTFNAIICLSSDIFSFAYSSSISSYRRLCAFFEVPLMQSLKPINWIGKNVQMPAQMNNYLYFLEKRIVIKEIWEDATGYDLIKSQESYISSSQIGYNDMVIWKRLLKHIFDRIQELSKEVKLQCKLIKRIKNLIHKILKEKPHLLYKNKIDQIIICCITCFLSINQIHQQQTLDKVFRDYNRLDMSYNYNKQGLTGDGKQMTIADFYNDIFLPEIQDIVKQNLTNTDFLLTPIRQAHQQMMKRQGQHTPFSKKYKQNQLDFGQNIRKISFSAFNISSGSTGLTESIFKKQSSQNPAEDPLTTYRKKLFIRNKQRQQESELKVEKQSQNLDSSQNNGMSLQIGCITQGKDCQRI